MSATFSTDICLVAIDGTIIIFEHAEPYWRIGVIRNKISMSILYLPIPGISPVGHPGQGRLHIRS